MVSKPHQFDVMVMPNLYGSILSNIGAALVGGPGMVPGMNIGKRFAVFEAVRFRVQFVTVCELTPGQGSRHAGRHLCGLGVANPTATLLSGTRLLQHVGLTEKAALINGAIERIIKSGKVGCRMW